MPRTKNDKLFLGKEFISKLSSTDDCYSFHSGVKKCNCLKVDDIQEVKKFFIKKLRIFGTFQCTGNTGQTPRPLDNSLECTSMKEVLSPPRFLPLFITLVGRICTFVCPHSSKFMDLIKMQ